MHDTNYSKMIKKVLGLAARLGKVEYRVGVLCRKVRIFSAWVSSPLVISHTEDELILK